jgi:DNA repair protein RadC
VPATIHSTIRTATIYKVALVKDSTVKYNYDKISSPNVAVRILDSIFADADREQLVVLFLDTKNKIVGVDIVATGTLNSCNVSIPNIFKAAIICNAASIIVSHNHPSGDPTPSPEDVRVTENLVQAGKLLDIAVLDHIVIGEDGRYVSLKERGLGF